MPKYGPDRIRNVAILGHSHEGKTTLAEAMLYSAGALPRLGSTDAGTAALDFEPEEQKRKISINLAVAHVEQDGYKVNVLDTPGFFDFAGQVRVLRQAGHIQDQRHLAVAHNGGAGEQ